MAIKMPGGGKVSNEEWDRLKTMFRAFQLHDDFRAELDQGLIRGRQTKQAFQEQRRFIRKEVRRYAGPNEPEYGPFFELEWMRAAREKPELEQQRTYNRELLWQAFYAPRSEIPDRGSDREAWRDIVGRKDRATEFAYSDT